MRDKQAEQASKFPNEHMQLGAVLEISLSSFQTACLEISLSSFQTACLSWTVVVRVRWDLRGAKFPVTLQHKFLRRSPIFLPGRPKKVFTSYISSALSGKKASNTAIQPTVYAP